MQVIPFKRVLGQPQQAIEDYGEAIRLEPQYAKAYYNRGNAYAVQGKHQQAIEDYDEAISLSPTYVKAYIARAAVYTVLNMDAEAQRDMALAVEMGADPTLLEVRIQELREKR